ncbi:MAG: hypothetical protein WAO21_08580 [Verrucomicrobiia bacterium]
MIFHFFANGTKLTYAAIGVGLLIAVLYFKLFFKDLSGFEDDAENASNIPMVDPDYDYVDSRWSNGKITIWILLSVGSGIIAYYQLPDWFPHLFQK